MSISQKILEIDIEAFRKEKIQELKERHQALYRNSIIVPFSGGIDSSTSLILAIEVFGSNKVAAWYCPDNRYTDKKTTPKVKKIIEYIGVELILEDRLRSVLRAAEVPHFHNFKTKHERDKWKSEITMFYLDGDKRYEAPMNMHTAAILSCENEAVAEAYAGIVAQHDARVLLARKESNKRNATLVCCANGTEEKIGWYTKDGIDNSGDVWTIRELYKTQVQALAKHIKVPEFILYEKSSSDMGIGDDEKILQHDYLDMDLILEYHLNRGMTPKEIAQKHGMEPWDIGTQTLDSIWRVVDVILKNRASEHMRNPKSFDTERWKDSEYRNCVDINQPYQYKFSSKSLK